MHLKHCDPTEPCDQRFSPEEFVQKKAELHAILDDTKEAFFAQSGLQQQALIKTYYKREALKEFEVGLGRLIHILQDVSDREDRPNSPMPKAYERQFYCRVGIPPVQHLHHTDWRAQRAPGKIEHIKAWGKGSHEATIQQDRINDEIDDHIHNALVLVTPVRDNAENFSAKIFEDVENVRLALRRALVTPSSEPDGFEP
uniref:Uncharacterized protein n=1 Tax=Haemonchus contortus TaxID=6289 RepID=A0A7I4YD17_HAECO